MMSDMKERFARIVKTTTGQPLNPKDIIVRDVRPNDNPDLKRNTRCFLMAVANGKLKHGMDFYYNRLDLGKIFRDQTPTIEMEYGTRTTTRGIAAILADRYGLEIYPDDIEPSGEFHLSNFPYDITLFATAGSLCVVGEVSVRLVDAGASLVDVMGVTNLAGVNPPNGNLDNKNQGATLSWNWEASPQLVEILGALTVGEAVPSTVIPYLDQLTQVYIPAATWVDQPEPAEYNMYGATLVYSGLRDNHPEYGAAGKRDYLYVIALTDAATRVGGELLFSVPQPQG